MSRFDVRGAHSVEGMAQQARGLSHECEATTAREVEAEEDGAVSGAGMEGDYGEAESSAALALMHFSMQVAHQSNSHPPLPSAPSLAAPLLNALCSAQSAQSTGEVVGVGAGVRGGVGSGVGSGEGRVVGRGKKRRVNMEEVRYWSEEEHR
eukprot:1895073-Rhodomonas_salina.1